MADGPFWMLFPAGRTLTAANGPDDILAMLVALTQLQPGDVLVVWSGDWRGSAVTGDRVLGQPFEMRCESGGVEPILAVEGRDGERQQAGADDVAKCVGFDHGILG